SSFSLLFSNPPPPPPLSTLSLHDALPICKFDFVFFDTRFADCYASGSHKRVGHRAPNEYLLDLRQHCLNYANLIRDLGAAQHQEDRKSTRLNSSHDQISYAVFCLKKKKNE